MTESSNLLEDFLNNTSMADCDQLRAEIQRNIFFNTSLDLYI